MNEERLAQIKRQLSVSVPNRFRDGIDRELIAEVERLRAALEQIADDGVEGYESPQKRIALAALDQEGEAQ